MCLVLCHKAPHVEELVQLFIIMTLEGEYNLPIKYRFVNESELPEILKQYPDAIVIGMSGSELDEHTRNGVFKKAKSSIELFAQQFGIPIEDKQFYGIMNYAKVNDTTGAHILLELGNLIKEFFKQKKSDKAVANWFFDYMKKDLEVLSSYSEEELKQIYAHLKDDAITNGKDYDKIFRSGSNHLDVVKQKYHTIVIPKLHSVNTLVAVRIAKRYGKQFGIKKDTKILFVSQSYRPRSGELAIGFGDGRFSIYPAERMLLACDMPYHNFQVIMNYLRSVNLRSGFHQYEFASMYIRRQIACQGQDNLFKSLWETFNWGSSIIDVYLRKQQNFVSARGEIAKLLKEKKAYITRISSMKVLAIHSFSQVEMSNAAFAKNGYQCDILIAKNTKGNMIILFKAQAVQKFNIPEVVRSIRKFELLNRGVTDIHTIYHLLSSEGSFDAVPWWFYHKEVGGIFNGSLTRTDVEPTTLSVSKIVGILKSNIK